MVKARLDQKLAELRLVKTRSQAESYIKLGLVTVNGQVVLKPGYFVSDESDIKLLETSQFVSRAGLKLESVAKILNLDFKDKIVLDVGSSTGGFSEFALVSGAKLVYAVDVGKNQMHENLRHNPKIELHESTDIRDFVPDVKPEIILMDVSFISVRELLPHIVQTSSKPTTKFVIMVKPQFEAGRTDVHKGVIKNDAIRRKILSGFEDWAKQYFVIDNKKDSEVVGARGNKERFYLLTLKRNSTTSPGRII